MSIERLLGIIALILVILFLAELLGFINITPVL